MNKILESFAKPFIGFWGMITNITFWSTMAEIFGAVLMLFLIIAAFVSIVYGIMWLVPAVQKIIKEIK